MPGRLLALNPKRKRRRLTAKQRKYFGKKKHRKSSVVIVSENPKRRRRLRRNPKRRSFRRNPIGLRRRFRRNPIGDNFINATLKPAAVGAVGAIASNWLLQYIPVPASLQTPTMMPLVQIGASFLVGLAGEAIGGPALGEQAAAGGVVVALYNWLNQNVVANSGLLNAGYGAGYGSGYAGGYGMNRYVGYIKRARMGARRRLGVRPIGISPLSSQTVRLGASASNVTKFRVLRDGSAGGRNVRGQRLGYIGPAKTLGRYMQGR